MVHSILCISKLTIFRSPVEYAWGLNQNKPTNHIQSVVIITCGSTELIKNNTSQQTVAVCRIPSIQYGDREQVIPSPTDPGVSGLGVQCPDIHNIGPQEC